MNKTDVLINVNSEPQTTSKEGNPNTSISSGRSERISGSSTSSSCSTSSSSSVSSPSGCSGAAITATRADFSLEIPFRIPSLSRSHDRKERKEAHTTRASATSLAPSSSAGTFERSVDITGSDIFCLLVCIVYPPKDVGSEISLPKSQVRFQCVPGTFTAGPRTPTDNVTATRRISNEKRASVPFLRREEDAIARGLVVGNSRVESPNIEFYSFPKRERIHITIGENKVWILGIFALSALNPHGDLIFIDKSAILVEKYYPRKLSKKHLDR